MRMTAIFYFYNSLIKIKHKPSDCYLIRALTLTKYASVDLTKPTTLSLPARDSDSMATKHH